jgi:hypothetical protein
MSGKLLDYFDFGSSAEIEFANLAVVFWYQACELQKHHLRSLEMHREQPIDVTDHASRFD